MSDSLLDDIKNLQESCFSIEDRLQYNFKPKTDQEIIRNELFRVRCSITSISGHAKQWDVQYKE